MHCEGRLKSDFHSEGWNTYLVDRYVGHVPTTVAERHSIGDKKRGMVEVFREQVSSKIDRVIDGIENAKGYKRSPLCPF